jgi:hypothetical protein
MPAPARWIRGPVADTAIAWSWVPFALVARSLEGSVGPLRQLLAGVLVFSFLHQPLTLALVYGSPERFRLHRRVFIWSPLVLFVVVAAGTQLSLVTLAALGGLWNAEHTLMQRYGVTRIYGRKAGDDRGGMEKAMLASWLLLALVWVAADARTPGLVARVNLDQVNASAVSTLHHAGGPARLLLIPVLAAVTVLAGRWLAAETRAAERNPAKHLYLLATAALFLTILIDPIAGFVAYIGSHAVEYFAVVHSALGRPSGEAGPLERVVARTGGTLFLGGYLAGVAGLLIAMNRWATPLQYTIVALSLGGLHIFYDGFIWKLRRPTVARGLAIPVAG